MKRYKPLIKICGVCCPDVAYQAAQLGVDYIGLVFHQESKRHIDHEVAKKVVIGLRRGGALPVAVCVNQAADEMTQLCRDLNIDTVQLHGDRARQQHQYLPPFLRRVFVLHVNASGEVLQQDDRDIQFLDVDRDYILFDGLIGGSGTCIKTASIQKAAGDFKYFVAGGLTANNVASIIDDCTPDGIDVSSGVENEAGVKDMETIRKFVLQLNKRGA